MTGVRSSANTWKPESILMRYFLKIFAAVSIFISPAAFADWQYDYYTFSGSWSQLPNFNTLTPVSSGTSPTIDISLRTQNDRFAFRFRNTLNVTTPGTYQFQTTSDDGSQLLIDGVVVVDNDFTHPAETVANTIYLDAGTYQFEITMFEQGGGQVLEAAYAPPGSGWRPLPASGSLDGPDILSETGTWGPIINWPHVPVSAANLPDGRVLTWASNEKYAFPGGRPEYTFTAIWDPSDNSITELDHPSHDMFCAHQVMLEDGNIFVSGGRNSGNSPWTSIFDINSDSWVPLNNMNRGRWYPTSLALADGSVFTAIGQGGGNTGELYDPDTGIWNILTGLNFNPMVLDYSGAQYGERDWWPLFNLAPDGRIFHSGPTPQMHFIDTAGAGTATEVLDEFSDWYPKHGTTIMYDEGKLLTAGGWVNGASIVSTNTAITIDLNQPVPDIQPTQPMAHARKFHNGVMLPNGEVLVVGGNTSGKKFNDEGAVYPVEIWNPETGQWRQGAPMAVARTYHSIALLLQDGTVFSAGGGLCGNGCAANHPDGQIYYPAYLYNPDGTFKDRPSILSAPAAIRAGDVFDVETDDEISHFSLIKLSSTTHAVNTDLRYLSVPFIGSGGSYELTAHSNPNVLTPGYWMLFALDAEGTPSISKVIQIRALNDDDPEPQNSLDFTYTSFADISPFQLNGAANSIGGNLRVADTTPAATGSVFYKTPAAIDSTSSFSTSFEFNLGGGAGGSEGLAFVLQGNESTELGAGGSGLGYQNSLNSLVVEIDTSNNTAGDINGNHVAVHANGDSATPLASAGAAFDLNDGASHRVWVDYSAPTETLTVYLAQDSGAAKPALPIITLNDFNLLETVGSLGYFGFTAASGGTGNNHDLQAWQLLLSVGDEPLIVGTISSPPQPADGAVNFTANASGEGLEYSWSFGDGSAQTAYGPVAEISHTYTQPGRYVVTLYVRDIHGVEQQTQFIQAVYPPLTANKPTASSTILVESITGIERAWVVNPDNNTVSVVNGAASSKIAEIFVGTDPRALALAPNNTVWVANKDSGTISIVDVNTLTVTSSRTLPTGSRPHGIVMDWVSGHAYVALEALEEVWKLDVYSDTVAGTTPVSNSPRHLSLTGDGSKLFVSRFITPPLPGESTLAPQTSDETGLRGGEVVVLDPSSMTVQSTVVLQHSDKQPAEITGPGFPNYLGPAIISPNGLSAYVPSKQDDILRGLSRDGQPLNHDHTVRAVTSVIDVANNSEIYGNRIDHDNASIARNGTFDPYGIYLYVALEGNRQIALVDAFAYTEIARIDVGFAPQSVATSANGNRVYVHNFMSRTVSVIDATNLMNGTSETLTVGATIPTVANEMLQPVVLQGKRLFYDAADPRLAAESYMACASCHNDGDGDGRVWDISSMGEGLRNTISLKGHAAMGHGPLHWSQNFDEVQDFENQIRDLAGGTGLMDDADYAATQDTLGTPKAGLSADLDALAAYVASLNKFEPSPYRQPSGALTPEGEAGKALFESANCAGCHAGDNLTDSEFGTNHDIGTITTASGNRLGGPLTGLDTPTLKGLWATAPYLHDGSALTLRDAVLAHDATALGGVTFTDPELDQLVSYLKQIDDSESYEPIAWNSQDIGGVAAPGSFSDDAGTLTMQASGADIWGRIDEFHYAYQAMEGDGQITARVLSLDATHDWAKAGVMMRADLDLNSTHAMMIVTAAKGADLQYRLTKGGTSAPSGTIDGITSTPAWVRLVREGNVVTGYVSMDGISWTQEDQTTIDLPSTVYVGVMATSHNDGVLTTAVFDNVSIAPTNPPVPDTTAPTVPSNVQASGSSTTTMAVSWTASTDTETGIGGYRVYRNGVQVGTTALTNFTDTGLAPSTSYQYTVSAFDNASPANHSAQSGVAFGTTQDEVFVSVPNVVNQPQATAEMSIEALGLVVGTVTTTNSDTVAAGNVISQNPTGGALVNEGSSIDLVVSVGAAPVNVPAVVGQNIGSATITLNNAGLVVGTVTRVISTTVPLDQVMSQNPAQGELVADGSAVDLTVSDGPPPPDLTAPTVPQGLNASAAGSNRINLSWLPSTDSESGVAGYRVFRDGNLIGTTAGTSYAALGLAPLTTYSFTVAAFDNAGNESIESAPAEASTDAVPTWTSQDVGAVGAAGSFSEDAGTLTMLASGKDIWSSLDEFHFAYQQLDGDGEIIARVTSLGNTHDWAKAGVMMRASLDANSAHAMMIVTSAMGADLQYRQTTGGSSKPSGTADGVSSAPTWLRLVREGDVFTGYVSSDGINWTQEDQTTLTLPATLYVGLAATSHNDGVLTTVTYDNVSVIPAVPPVPDTTPPTDPSNVQAVGTSTTTIEVTWDASTDAESGVAGYQVRRDGVQIGETTATSFTDVGLTPSTTYIYTVFAYDAAVPTNVSGESASAFGTTEDEIFVNVPNVLNIAQASAEAAITSAGLVVGNVTSTNSDTVAPGNVISQNPAGGASVNEGVAVDLVISLGAAPVTVPNVVGQSLVGATVTLNNAGLVVGSVTRVLSATVPLDQVMDQDPDQGIDVADGSAVNLIVSDGPPPPDVTAPTVPQGLTATAAGANRINLSWSPSSDSETGVAGYRIFQNGVAVGTSATTSYAALGLAPVTNYTFTVAAYDNAAPVNESAQSAPANATTEAEVLWTSQDIGGVATPGSFSDSGGTLTMEASGYDIWGRIDEFHFAYQTLEGDGEIIGRVVSLDNTNDFAKAGVMMRADLSYNSAHAMMIVTAARGADLQWRATKGGTSAPSGTIDGVTSAPAWVRLVREGDVFTGYVSSDGINWVEEDSTTLSLPSTLYIGVGATSHNDGVLTTAVFDNVSITPAGPIVADTTAPSVPQNLQGAPATADLAAAVNYATGVKPHGLTTADMDNDGVLDLVTTESTDDTASILFGNGDGSFGNRVIVGVGSKPKAAAVGDFNNDGFNDIAVADQDASTVSIITGLGARSFSAAVTYPVCFKAHDIVVHDLDGDGDLDVATSCHSTTLVSVLPGNGDGTFAAAIDLDGGSRPHSLAIGDFNQDSIPDIAVASYGEQAVSILYGMGGLAYASPVAIPVGSDPHSIRVGDLNGDGMDDLAVANDKDNSVGILLGGAGGAFAAEVSYAVGLVPKGVAIGDVDNDGNLDVVAGNTGGNYPSCCVAGEGDNISVLYGAGDGTFSAAVEFETGRTIFAAVVADFNSDGLNDIATANYDDQSVSILMGVAGGQSAVDLSWEPSNDGAGSGVAGYRIYRDGSGVPIAEVGSGNTSYRDTGLSPNTNYSYTVSAFDAATPENESAESASESVQTLP